MPAARINLADLPDPGRHTFVHGDICDRPLVDRLLRQHLVDTIVHFAAETHVDRSIFDPGGFLKANVVGTFTLLEAARQYWLVERALPSEMRFHHISTATPARCHDGPIQRAIQKLRTEIALQLADTQADCRVRLSCAAAALKLPSFATQ